MSDIGSAFSTYTKQVNQAADTQTADLKKAADVENKSYTEYKSFLDKHMDDFNKLEKEGAETFKPFKAPQAEDPLKSYGATMAGLMGIASFFTHSSMVGAMDAATASINAARQGNTEAYNQAFTEWKNNNEIMQKKLAWETDAWSTIGKMAETDYNAALGHAQALSSQTKDATATAMIRAGMFDKLLDVKKTQADMGRAADEHSQSMIEQGEKVVQFNNYKDWVKSNPNASPQEKAEMLNQVLGRGGAGAIVQAQKDQLIQQLENDKILSQGGKPLTGDQEAAIRQKVEASFKPSAAGAMGGREATYMNRVISGATLAVADAGNIMDLPITVSRGVFGGRGQGPTLFDATKEDLANTVTSQEAQLYNNRISGIQRNLAAIEAAGLAPSGSLQHMMDNMVIKEGDTYLTKLDKMAQVRQIIEKGLEPYLNNPRVSEEQRGYVKTVVDSAAKAIPFTHQDVTRLYMSNNSNKTIRDYASVLSPSGQNIPQKAVDELKQHPTTDYKASFDKHFGKGSATYVLQSSSAQTSGDAQ